MRMSLPLFLHSFVFFVVSKAYVSGLWSLVYGFWFPATAEGPPITMAGILSQFTIRCSMFDVRRSHPFRLPPFHFVPLCLPQVRQSVWWMPLTLAFHILQTSTLVLSFPPASIAASVRLFAVFSTLSPALSMPAILSSSIISVSPSLHNI